MNQPIRVVQYGLGPIGLETARSVVSKQATGQVQLVGAIDIDPAKAGKDIGDLLGLPPVGVIVSENAEVVIQETWPQVVLHTTTSFLPRIRDQLLQCVEGGAHVISSTEELFFPYERYPGLAAELNQKAEEHGVVILGTGVNPGFVMDTLALTATGMCTDVTSVHMERIVDAGKRRLPLQVKVGAGLSVGEFEERKATGTFGHIGLRESLLFVAAGLLWYLDRIEERLEPVVSPRDVTTNHLKVSSGQVAGIHHAITGYRGDAPVLSLDLKMFVGAEESYDSVRVEGTPPIHLVIRGGIFGDTATVAALVNAIPIVVDAPPGLRTMKDLPVPRAFATALLR